ncbi:MAG: hypothetical protein ABI183_13960 [Polyangiaceae bacterium]
MGPKQTLPADGTIQLAFDRLLLPATAVRQSFILVDANKNALEPIVTYDPVTRVVSLSNPNAGGGAWLTPGQPYSVFLQVAKMGDDESGLRAIDGAPLSASSAGEIGFLVGAATNLVLSDSKTNFCNDVLPIFSARCSASQCHGAPTTIPINANTDPATRERFPDGKTQPAAGLLLETSTGVQATAIGRVAQGANTGALAGTAEAQGAHFGFDMPIVDPGNPSNSWLMYKLLLAVPQPDALEADRDGGGTGVLKNTVCTGAPLPVVQPAPNTQYELMSDDERARLGNYVLGKQMPYPPDLGASPSSTDNEQQNLTMPELERVRAWIAAGAVVSDCSVCSN